MATNHVELSGVAAGARQPKQNSKPLGDPHNRLANDRSSGVQTLHSTFFICNIQHPSFQATQPFFTLSKIRNFRSFFAGSTFTWAQLQKALHMVQLHQQRKLHVFSHGLTAHHRAVGCGLVAAGPPGAERHL